VRRSGISFGEHCYINRNCCIDIRGPLKIGAHVSISPDVTILTATHGVNDPTFFVRHRPVVIEDNVWIGTRSMILPGVTLGRGSVVAAGAVVTRDVGPLEVVAGVPARKIAVRDAAAANYRLHGRLPLFE
jgi:maltose O-acetyltransferase